MFFFYKHIIQPLLSKSLGKKSLTSNPYLGVCIEADEGDVIADAQFRIGMAYQNGAYLLPQDNEKALEYYHKESERGHAVAQYLLDHPNQTWNNNYLIYVKCNLTEWIEKLQHRDKDFSIFYEPDLNNSATAIAVEDSGRLFRKLKLVG